MVRKYFFVLIFLVLMASLVQGQIFSETVENGAKFSTPLGEFSARLFEGQGFISLFGEGYSFKLAEGECASKGNYKFCFKSKSEKEYDYKLDKQLYSLNIEISEIKPTISISADEEELLIGEKTIISVSVQNHEDQRMKFNFETAIPRNFKLIDTDKIKSTGALIKDTKLINNEKVDFSFSIEKIAEGDITLVPKLEYLYEDEYIKFDLEPIKIKDKKRLRIDADFSSKNTELLEDFALNIGLDSRLKDKDLIIENFYFEVPSIFIVKEYNDSLSKENNVYSWKGTVKEEDVEFMLILSAKDIANASIKFFAEVSDEDAKESISEEINFTTKFKPLRLRLNVPSNIRGSRNLIKAHYNNVNKLTQFKNINCELSGLYNATYIIKKSIPDLETVIEDSYFWIDNKTVPGNYTEVFNCMFELPNKEIMFETAIKNITVNLTPEDVEVDEEDKNVEGIEETVENETGVVEEDHDEKPGIFKRIWNWMFGWMFNKEGKINETTNITSINNTN